LQVTRIKALSHNANSFADYRHYAHDLEKSLHRNEITLKCVGSRFDLFSEATKPLFNFSDSDRVIMFLYELNLEPFATWSYLEDGGTSRLNCRCHGHKVIDDQWRQYCSLALYGELPMNRTRAMFSSNINTIAICLLSIRHRYTRGYAVLEATRQRPAAHNRMMSLLVPGK